MNKAKSYASRNACAPRKSDKGINVSLSQKGKTNEMNPGGLSPKTLPTVVTNQKEREMKKVNMKTNPGRPSSIIVGWRSKPGVSESNLNLTIDEVADRETGRIIDSIRKNGFIQGVKVG